MSECDDNEGGGHDRGGGSGVEGDMLQGFEVLEHGALSLGGARRADNGLLRVSSSGVGAEFFVGVMHRSPRCPPAPESPTRQIRYRAVTHAAWQR